MTKYIFITGGVVSSLGKGIVAASLGRLLVSKGYSVSVQKFDPYINVDPGTMSPFQHGEVFVTEDGAETDLDLGHYERFIDTNLSKINNITSGKVYQTVIEKERKGEYLGATVQMIPHITGEIKSRIISAAKKDNPDILIVETGGTVGDIEGLPFIEAIRQFRSEIGIGNSMSIHVTLLPYLPTSGELKTKPSQHSVNTLRSYGIQPEMLVLRTQVPVSNNEKEKLALFCSVDKNSVIECKDLSSIYEVPLYLENQNITKQILKTLNLEDKTANLDEWKKLIENIKDPKNEITVALVGKYTELNDAYISVVESIKHAGFNFNTKTNIKWIASEDMHSFDDIKENLSDIDGIVVPGGFGTRGIEGILKVIKYARENNIPLLGLCLGMQCSVIEYARNVAKLDKANSTEFDKSTKFKVVDLMEEQKNILGYGGSMRLGSYPCKLLKGSKAEKLYNSDSIHERHRHRYEFNNEYKQILEENGLVISGMSPDGTLAEIVEIPENDFFVACQFHPEFKSRPQKPHPLFKGLIEAILKQKTSVSS